VVANLSLPPQEEEGGRSCNVSNPYYHLGEGDFLESSDSSAFFFFLGWGGVGGSGGVGGGGSGGGGGGPFFLGGGGVWVSFFGRGGRGGFFLLGGGGGGGVGFLGGFFFFFFFFFFVWGFFCVLGFLWFFLGGGCGAFFFFFLGGVFFFFFFFFFFLPLEFSRNSERYEFCCWGEGVRPYFFPFPSLGKGGIIEARRARGHFLYLHPTMINGRGVLGWLSGIPGSFFLFFRGGGHNGPFSFSCPCSQGKRPGVDRQLFVVASLWSSWALLSFPLFAGYGNFFPPLFSFFFPRRRDARISCPFLFFSLSNAKEGAAFVPNFRPFSPLWEPLEPSLVPLLFSFQHEESF